MRIEKEFHNPNEPLSGQITVTTAGTAVQGTAGVTSDTGFLIKALAGNAGVAYVGSDGAGDVTSSNGMELSADQFTTFYVNQLSHLWFDAANNGDGFSWNKA